MPRIRHAFLLVLLTPTTLLAAGHVFNENFSVLTPERASRAETNAYAERMLAQAEKYRKDIAQEWLGAELPAGLGRTHINVAFSDSEDQGLTWPDDGPRRKLHTLHLATTPERALGNTLKHEMCHVVFATQFPEAKRLPAWIEEGIASRYDDVQRSQSRLKMVRWWSQTENWPEIERVLEAERFPASDRVGYTVAASLAEFLLGRADKETLLDFSQAARADLPRSLRTHYQIQSLADLQAQWQTWARVR